MNFDASRRDFVRASAILSAAAFVSLPRALRGQPAAEHAAKPKPLKILFLGGTGMLGPHVVKLLIDRGHAITLFNRGNRDEMFPDLAFIEGNRIRGKEPGYDRLREQIDKGATWDAVIDTASVHTWVEDAASLLKDVARQYTYISSISAYAGNTTPNADESDTLATMPDAEANTIIDTRYNMQYYGAVKARAEAAAERHFPGRAIVHRPGLLVGPRDGTHRFTYWPHRVREGGEVLAPGNPQHAVQLVDVRDLAAFVVRGVEHGLAGAYNVNGPVGGGLTIGGLLDACKAATNAEATFTWADETFLAERGVHAWMHMPVWVPPSEGSEGFHTRSLAKAVSAGLTTRPIAETIRDTLAWFDDDFMPKWKKAMAEKGEPDATFSFGGNLPGISREKERELLDAWHARSTSVRPK